MSEDVVLTDETVRTGDDLVHTTDELVQSTDDAVAPGIVTMSMASGVLSEAFGNLVDAGYLAGKTRFRDALCARFELSQLTAEELCDELERAGKLRFVEGPEGAGWHVHEEERGDAAE